jgi:uncharacterized damage-inducible protein DinB
MAVAPNDKYDWKPSETAMTLGKLMNHLWIAETGLTFAAIEGSFPKEFPESITNTQDLIAAFDKSHEEMVAKVSTLTPEFLAEDVAPFGPDRNMPRMYVLNALHEHEIHHRGQLYVYLRMLGCEIPPLFA